MPTTQLVRQSIRFSSTTPGSTTGSTEGSPTQSTSSASSTANNTASSAPTSGGTTAARTGSSTASGTQGAAGSTTRPRRPSTKELLWMAVAKPLLAAGMLAGSILFWVNQYREHYRGPIYPDQAYDWLEDKRSLGVYSFLSVQNNNCDKEMAHTKPLQETLYNEFVGRIKEDDVTVPIQHGGYEYFRETVQGLNYPIHYRRKVGAKDAEKECLLDLNSLSKEFPFVRLGEMEVSPDNRYLAYSLDTTGAEQYTLRFKDLKTNQVLSDSIPNTYYGLAWDNDNATVYYTTLDSKCRPHQIWKHQLGSSSDQLMYEEADERFHLHVHRSKSGGYIFVNADSQVTSEVLFKKTNQLKSQFTVFKPRQQNIQYSVTHHKNRFFIITNEDGAFNSKILEAPVDNRNKTTEYVPHQSDVKIQGIDEFNGHLVVYQRQNGLRQFEVHDLANNNRYSIPFNENVYTIRPADNPEFESTRLRFGYTSLTTPPTVYEIDLNDPTRHLNQLKQDEVKGFNRELYQSERLFAAADDGTKIPISLVYRKDRFKKDGSNPILLYGYGAYEISVDPTFDMNRLSLLDRGFVFAIAHVRGGGEMGRLWYENGKLLKKKNTFTDFIACAKMLQESKYTSIKKTCIVGRSAGGLLIGAVITMKPELFHTAVAHVPFLDVFKTLHNESLPLTIIEWEEWGNPNDPVYAEYIKSYSPFDNIRWKTYPNLLLTAGLNDPRVSYHEPAKFFLKMHTDRRIHKQKLLLKTEMGAGHGGKSGRYESLKDVAFEYAFLLDDVGIKE
eukprot:GILK01005351.1.p1 GENE.GILK01005351.1~~GILK01005351.1.p1  ORF type:complete len:831 (+),score=168.23 GILK01005351.1:153-2495(+)